MKIAELDVQIDSTVQTDVTLLATEADGDAAVGITVVGFEEGENTGWVSRVFVRSEYRGRGYGRALVERAIELCRERGRAFVSLSVADENEAAQRLYQSLGFVPFMKGQKGYVQYIKSL